MKKILLFCLAAVLLLSACGDKEESITIYAMDTVMQLSAFGKNAEAALREAEAEILRLDGLWRRGSDKSEVYALNAKGEAEVSPDTADVIARALEISDATGGVFDITVAPVMDIWGFYGGSFRVPSDGEIAEKLAKVSYKNVSAEGGHITLCGGAQVDLGGIAKGFAADRVEEIFRKNGVKSGIISLGGNVRAVGAKPNGKKWTVAVQNPSGEGYVGTLAVESTAVVTSGSYQRCFERDGVIYHHIIDTSTGRPAESGVSSVTVISADGTLADGLSTALFVMGVEEGTQYWRRHGGFEVIFITDGGEIYVTEGAAAMFESDLNFKTIE